MKQPKTFHYVFWLRVDSFGVILVIHDAPAATGAHLSQNRPLLTSKFSPANIIFQNIIFYTGGLQSDFGGRRVLLSV